MMRGMNDKCEKIKFFARLLALQGFIVKTKNQKNFELYCFWAGGTIVRKGRAVLCVSKTLQS
jgi:hypothetical protein